MLVYQLVLIAATLVSAASAGLVYAQAPERRPSQLLAWVLLLGSGWAGSELAVSMAASEEQARFWMRWGSLGWVPLGGLLPHLVLQSLDESIPGYFARYRGFQSAVAWLETGWSLVMVGAVFAGTDLVVRTVFRTEWGWSFTPGPLLSANFAITTLGVLASSWVIARCSRRASDAESLQLPWVWIAILLPSVMIFVTDVLVPSLGIDFPRFGGASMAVTGLCISWTVVHYGMSFVTPRGFGEEILNTLDEGVALVSHDGDVVRVNQAFARMSGYGRERLRGMRIRDLVDREPGAGQEQGDLRRDLAHASGEKVPVSVSVSVLRERQQNEVGRVVVLRDLRELEDLRRSSMVNARLAAVGQLAAGLAHEINNPIAFVAANLRLLEQHWKQLGGGALSEEERADLAAEGHELIEESLEGVERASGIMRGVKHFTHTGSSDRAPARVEDLVGDCLKMLRSQMGPGVRVRTDFGELPPVVCSAGELEQVFLNLLINALHAVEGEGCIEVSTRLDEDLAIVTIRDDGRGIEPDVLDRIFDPFFTTKPAGEGTGLGLGIAHQVVTRHGGVITVHSTPGQGATFRVHLPLSRQD